MENIPPTQVIFIVCYVFLFMHYSLLLQAALLQHCNRAIYQCSIWSKSFTSLQNAPLPSNYGWKKNDNFWVPVWTDLPEAAKASRELLKCGCKAEPLCTRKCLCKAAGLSCTGLCNCGGHCEDSTLLYTVVVCISIVLFYIIFSWFHDIFMNIN